MEDDEEELKRIRNNKYMSRVQKLKEQKVERDEKRETIALRYNMALIFLSVRLTPDAFKYLIDISEAEPQIYKEMFKMLVPREIINNLELVIQDIYNGWRPPTVITKDGIINVYRKVKGVKNIIRIGKEGDFKTIDAFLKKDNEEDTREPN